tara:strand:+ start:831 stop:1115 length:285 start_codon:yes stop_codon:yes gene_type:complete
MSDELLKAQVNALIRDEIQDVINEYVDQKEEGKKSGIGFVENEDQELKVNIPENEVDKLIKEYKKIKKRQRKSNLHQVKQMGLVDKHGRPLNES